MTEMKLDLVDEDDPVALHCHYKGQTEPQRAFLSVDLEHGDFTAEYDPSVDGARSLREFHGIVRTYAIPVLTAAAANRLLRRLAPLAEQILRGGDVHWDGQNDVGVLDADARAAEDELSGEAEQLREGNDLADQVTSYEAYDWFGDGGLPDELSADTTDEELARIAESAEREAVDCLDYGHTVLRGAKAYLTARRDEMRAERD